MEYEEFKEKAELKLTEANPDGRRKSGYRLDEADEYLVEGVYEQYQAILDCESGLNMAMKEILSIFAG